MGHRRKRIRLIHKLRQLARTEELLDDSRYGLAVNQVVGHEGFDFLKRHALLDRALHANQADAILVLKQLTHHANTAVTKVIDVVDLLGYVDAVLQVNEIFDC